MVLEIVAETTVEEETCIIATSEVVVIEPQLSVIKHLK